MSDVLAFTDVGTRPAQRRGARRQRPRTWMGWLLPVGLLVAWQLGASTGLLSSTILPNPVDIWRAAWRLSASGELLANMETSTLRALAG